MNRTFTVSLQFLALTLALLCLSSGEVAAYSVPINNWSMAKKIVP